MDSKKEHDIVIIRTKCWRLPSTKASRGVNQDQMVLSLMVLFIVMVSFIFTFLLMLHVLECFIEFQYRGWPFQIADHITVIVSIVVNLGRTAFEFAQLTLNKIDSTEFI